MILDKPSDLGASTSVKCTLPTCPCYLAVNLGRANERITLQTPEGERVKRRVFLRDICFFFGGGELVYGRCNLRVLSLFPVVVLDQPACVLESGESYV